MLFFVSDHGTDSPRNEELFLELNVLKHHLQSILVAADIRLLEGNNKLNAQSRSDISIDAFRNDREAGE